MEFGIWNLELCNGVPSRILTSNLALRTRPLCVLSYGDNQMRNAECRMQSAEWIDGVMDLWIDGKTPTTPPHNHPTIQLSNDPFHVAGPLELLRVQGFEMVRASGNAPDPGTHLVRCEV